MDGCVREVVDLRKKYQSQSRRSVKKQLTMFKEVKEDAHWKGSLDLRLTAKEAIEKSLSGGDRN